MPFPPPKQQPAIDSPPSRGPVDETSRGSQAIPSMDNRSSLSRLYRSHSIFPSSPHFSIFRLVVLPRPAMSFFLNVDPVLTVIVYPPFLFLCLCRTGRQYRVSVQMDVQVGKSFGAETNGKGSNRGVLHTSWRNRIILQACTFELILIAFGCCDSYLFGPVFGPPRYPRLELLRSSQHP